jgi:hypothetical protein
MTLTDNFQLETGNMATEEKGDGRTVQLKGVRLVFTDRLKTAAKTSKDAQKETYGCSIILEANSPHFEENKAKVMSAIRKAGELKWKNPEAFVAIAEDSPKRICYRDGSKFKNAEGKIYNGFEGNKGLVVAGPEGGKIRPKTMLDRYRQNVEVKDIDVVFYSGTLADVFVGFYGTDNGSRGIFASLEGVRSHQRGDRLSGGVTIDADDFDDMPDDEFDAPPAAKSAPAVLDI